MVDDQFSAKADERKYRESRPLWPVKQPEGI
jgi:hypothetical protein